MCVTAGHEQVPAAARGIYEDPEDGHQEPGVTYCATCTRALALSRVFHVEHVYAPDQLGRLPCPHCHGTGRIDLDS